MAIIIGIGIFFIFYLLFVTALRFRPALRSIRALACFCGTGIFVHIGVLHFFQQTEVSFQFGISSIVLYILLFCTVLFISATPLLGEASPSSYMILTIRRLGPIAESKLVSIVAPILLIQKRVEAMKKLGWIEERRGFIHVTFLGKKVYSVVRAVRNILMVK